MGFQDIAFLLPELVFSPHFSTGVVEVKASGPPQVVILWLGGKQGHAPCKILSLQQSLFLCQLNLMETKDSQRRGESGHPHFREYHWI